MHARLAEAMDFVEEKRRELLASVEGVAPADLSRRTAPDAWSVAQILDHLRMVESGVARLITKRVQQAKAAGIAEEQSTESVIPSFEPHRIKLESGRLTSPEPVRPNADPDPIEALGGLAVTRQALREAASSANGVALGEIKHTHAILGELDLYQWLIFLGQHEVRHRKQIERTLTSLPR
ncbi:MAG TPA: DinB family protein [Gemmatimonadaceae bacterium]|nr:DinB family protein [Gemmatimonadaceae bacterium]